MLLRSFFISLSKAEWARQLLINWRIARTMSRRFVAGEILPEAIQVIKDLNNRGFNTTLDHLGEHTLNRDDAIKATQDILEIIDVIEQSNVRSNVSIKLSQIGFNVDMNLCHDNLKVILEHASKYKVFIRIDMEDSSTVDGTLYLYQAMRKKYAANQLGLVIQSYLYRSQDDVKTLLKNEARIRLCKGAYLEPPELAYPKKKDVDANYDKITSLLMDTALAIGAPSLSEDGRIPPLPAIATHDMKRINYAQTYARKIGLPLQAYEFQMLYGIRRDIQEALVKEGYPTRIYVPFGTQWYPYFMRRLAERPANVWFLLSNYFRK